MGRSRAGSNVVDMNLNQSRSKKRKTVSGIENVQTTSTAPQEKCAEKLLYHCNYCYKDISGLIRIKCATCPDFDLCIECFSVGAEVNPHRSNHPYRVMDNLAFPLICPEWNADEEMLLIEGLGMYGFGNWTEVGEHVGSKTRSQCIDHYNVVYMNSPCSPLPDMSHIMGKSRQDLLAMAQKNNDVTTTSDIPLYGNHMLQEGQILSPKDQFEAPVKEAPACKSSSRQDAGSAKKASNIVQVKNTVKVEVAEFQSDRSIGEKKPRLLGEDLSGYNYKREEFEIEYDNDAEQMIADMEFKESDTDAERDLKLTVLRIYSKRLDERKHRKDFILERNLLYPNPIEKNLSSEENDIHQRFKVFTRFHSNQEHDEFVKSIIEEQQIKKRIQELQEARETGCRTMAEVIKFLNEKRNQSTKGNEDNNSQGLTNTQLDAWDISDFPGADLLSETEKQLCSEIRILPSHYLKMLQTLTIETLNGKITKKSDAHDLFKFEVDPSKVDKVYDMMIQKGITTTT